MGAFIFAKNYGGAGGRKIILGPMGSPEDPGLPGRVGLSRMGCGLAKGKILVMDDEDLVRNVAGKMLEFLGYQVVLSREGREAISIYQHNLDSGAPFDAVILDLVVPGGLGGGETLAELLRLDPGVKAIISSGYGDNAPQGSKSEGHVAMIGKPYELKKLGDTLDKVLSASHA